MPPSWPSKTRFGIRQVFGSQPEIERVAGEPAGGKGGEQTVAFAAEHRRVGLAQHLNVTEREVVLPRPEIEIVEPQRLLKPGRVRLPRDRDQGRVVVAHVVAPDDAGA